MSDIAKLYESILLESAMEAMRDRFHQDHGLHPDVFNHLYHNALPENNKSLGDMEWLANREVNGENVAENHETVKHVMSEFAKPAIKSKLQKKKANQYKTFQDLHDAIAPHIGSAPTKKESEESDTKTIYKSDTHIIKQHLSHESMVKAAYLPEKSPYSDVEQVKTEGGKCKATWCVSAESAQGKSYFDQYTENGKHPFYTIEHTDKHPSMPNRKFAVLADPKRNLPNNEVRDELQNEPVNLGQYAIRNKDILHTKPGQYISNLLSLHKNEDGSRITFKDGKGYHNIRKTDEGHEHVINGYDGEVSKYNLDNDYQKHGESFEKTDKELRIGNYVHGKMHGDFRNIDANGTVRRFHQYDMNRVKSDTYYNPNGVPDMHSEYNEDGKETKRVVYHDNGRVMLKKVNTFKKGVVHQTTTRYSSEGNLKSKTNHVGGNATSHEEYYPDGSLKLESKFNKSGVKHGLEKTYHPSGNLAGINHFVDNELISSKTFEDNDKVKTPFAPKLEQTTASEYIRSRIPHEFIGEGIDHHISENDNKITLNKLVIPKARRGFGIGGQYMGHLTNYADLTGKRIELTPSTDFGATSKARLVKFYKGHGFVENKGRNKDFSISNTMYRHPDKSVNESIQSTFRKMIEG